ncbi:hypothetical protein GGR54DRAFT_199287 [Hypoxylon sp. NC1633]|nr:hypothetical protein GGR54DRAFT_199287 [Hypoxylon sp. NC1633]
MAASEVTQALLAAFFFGILFNAASAALVLYVIGHGSAIFRDGLRLVLILFLTSSAAWALVEFLATIIEPTAASTCQVAVIFSSVFDQMGRVFVEQYLVWAARNEGKNTALSVAPQILVLGRFGVGIAFVGLTRSEFDPTCVPLSSVLPLAIIAIALDVVIVSLVAIQGLSMKSTNAPDDRQDLNRKKGVTLITIGLAIWIGMSVILLLGMKGTALVLKTTLPALGLAILIALVTVFSGTLVTPRGPPPRRPDSPTTRDISRDRDLSSSDSADYPPTHYEDVKGMNARVITAYASRHDGGIPGISVPITQMSGIAGLGDQGNTKRHAKESAWAKATGGKLVISNPILMEQEGVANPLDRIPTVDLATAASNEKERRTKLAQRGSTLIAQRPAPQPPNGSGRGGMLSREISLKRKEVTPSSLAELERSVSTRTAKTTGGLSVEVNASSSSSELSPGTEKMRRRSPRHPLPPPIPTTFQPIRPGEPIRIPIPRPRDPPQAPKTPEPTKTPLQRRPTTGLPSNPRAQAMKSLADQAESQSQETVMFVNDIVYNDQNAVNEIVQGASKTPMTSLDSDGSVVNRPRPIPRKSDKDRQVFPAELSPGPGHKRSKSGGSIASRKSILQSMPGSPTQLPPLPPPPKSAGSVPRLLPNDTKSMTFNEKMDYLYTAPVSAPSTATTESKRQSVVPEMPPLPATYISDTKSANVESITDSEASSDRRVSKTTDRSSIRTTSILGIDDVSQRYTQRIASTRKAADELGQSWLPGITENERRQREARNRTNRKSSPVIPVGSHFSMSSMRTESRVRDDDATTTWGGSVHSPVVAVGILQSRLNARSTYIKKDSRGSEKQAEQSESVNLSDKMATVKSDPQNNPHDIQKTANLDEDDALREVLPAEQVGLVPFHHRVGDECPSFSTRKDRPRLRKMPPPTPLILNGRNTKTAIIVQAAEPSPLESPEAAYQMIQAQLRRFEEPNRESVESQGQRLVLLENLELEMGQLENKWQSQYRLGRDSMSSIQSSPSRDSRPTSLAAERRASRQASMRNSGTRSKGEDSMGMLSSQSSGLSSENTHASAWQARLAEAQMEYMKNTPDLIMKRNNLNFMSVSKAALGSPSPPDTDDSEYESEVPGSVQFLSAKVYAPAIRKHELWKPQSPTRNTADSGLWAGGVEKSRVASQVRELPGLSVRPAVRKNSDPLVIESSQLWQKPYEMVTDAATASGLWKKHIPSHATRPATIRPPRRNRRVTLLPDILENPEPLPGKRDTLGIFQFPWGEKSEHASIQPRLNRAFAAMPGTMTTGGLAINASLDARSRQLEAEELTTSFFDDYEAEEEGDNFDYFSDSDGGDDFDENTLWEIASLLKTEKFPSKNSLLPLPLQISGSVKPSVSAEDVADMIIDDYRDDGVVLEEPIPVDRLSFSTSEPHPAGPLLWAAQDTLRIHHVFGLPQPDFAIWTSYTTQPERTVRFHSRFEDITPVQSSKLWELRSTNAVTTTSELLWSGSRKIHRASVVSSQTKASLWVRSAVMPARETFALFEVNLTRADYRSTSKDPAALQMTRKSRALRLPLGNLTSTTLWGENVVPTTQSLWKKPRVARTLEQDGLFDNRISRLEYRRTVKEPAAISMKRTTGTAAAESLAILKTNELWSKEIPVLPVAVCGPQLFTSQRSVELASQSSKTNVTPGEITVLLWEQPKRSPEPGHEGLFDASLPRSNYRRSSNAPAAIFMSKKPRTSKEPLPTLTSTGLWGRKPVGHSVPVPMAKPIFEEAPKSVRANLMWGKSTFVVPESDDDGLFDVNNVRIDYRRTSKLPAAVNMTRKPRKTAEFLAVLTSTQLWEAQARSTDTTLSTKASLWNKAALSTAVRPNLFQLDSNRKIYRTTSAEPVALKMARKPRLANEPLPRIESTRLWTDSQITSVELDWITISSVRPESPSVASISAASSAPSSPVTDSLSVKTSTTKASSAKSAGSFFGGWFGKKKMEAPEDLTLNPTPQIPELPQDFVVKNLDEIVHKKPAYTPLRQLHRPSVAYHGDWETALREAIADSYPGTMTALRAFYPQDWETELQAVIKASHMPPRITRQRASPRDWSCALHTAIATSYPEIRFSRGQTLPAQWEAALQEAIVGSSPTQTTEFDVTIRHPVFMGSMETTAETFHPAISPNVLKRRASGKEQAESTAPRPISFDVAVRHPVFFGSMKTTANIVHPAIETSAPLWAKPVEARVAALSGLWVPSNGSISKPQPAPASFATKAEVQHRPRKATRGSEIGAGPEFGPQGMWRRTQMFGQSQNRDWLDDSTKKRFTRIELRY